MLTQISTTTRTRPPACLRFTPTAWAKLLFLRDAGNSEIGGFGITRAADLLAVEEIRLVEQVCSPLHVAFDDQSVADYFDAQVDAGRRPNEFGRIWIHTHPGSSAEPSATDEATFARVFGGVDWAIMFILARGGQTYARLRYNVGPGADVPLPVDVDFGQPFAAAEFEAWQAEYDECVRIPKPPELKRRDKRPRFIDEEDETPAPVYPAGGIAPSRWYEDWYEYASDHPTPEEHELGYIHDFY